MTASSGARLNGRRVEKIVVDGRLGSGVSQEDESLKSLVAKYGGKSWTNVARGISGRSGKSCRLR